VALFNVGFVYYAWRYGEARCRTSTRRSSAWDWRSPPRRTCALAPIFVVSFIFMMVWEVVYSSNPRESGRAAWAETKELLRRAILPLFTASVLFLGVWVVFYTSLFAHWDTVNGVSPALKYWLGQHNIQRIGGPWYYYFPDLWIYEQLIFLGVIVLSWPLLRPRRRRALVPAMSRRPGSCGSSDHQRLDAYSQYAPFILLAGATLAGLVHMRRWLPDRFTASSSYGRWEISSSIRGPRRRCPGCWCRF
jgi:hypothetical protein